MPTHDTRTHRESANPPDGWRPRLENALTNVVFPIVTTAFLTGMFWIGDHGLYSKLFYWLIALPALLVLAIRPGSFLYAFDSRIVVAYVFFACYMSLTLFWSTTEDGVFDLIKRPLYVMLFLYFVLEFGRRRSDLLHRAVRISAMFATMAALFTIVLFYMEGASGRLRGFGALFNPLLTSHVFGFFIAVWMGIYFAQRKLFEPLSILSMLLIGALLLSTGSRTPLLAVVATSLWLAALTLDRKSLVVLGLLVSMSAAIVLLAPEMVMQRGLSYRTEIWAEVLRQIAGKVWFGHGYGASMKIPIASLQQTFSDPHNLTLAVFYAGGVFGLLFWVGLYFTALFDGWRLRADKWVLVCSAMVVYGLVAGMTEGGSFMTRPKEHWFLIWIPLALLAEATFGNRTDAKGK